MKKKDAKAETKAAENETIKNEETQTQEQDTAKEPQAENPLQAQVEQLQKELKEQKELLLRTAAEYDNYRKRTAKEKDATWNDAKASTVAEFLPALDNLERALTAEGDAQDIKKGVEMIHKQFLDALTKLKVEEIPTVGETLDPSLHHAVMHVEDEEAGDGEIVECFQKGYKTGDRVIRYSMVKVAN